MIFENDITPKKRKGTKMDLGARSWVFDKRSILLAAYAIYIAFILVSTIPYIAEHQTRYQYDGQLHSYHIVFEEDGNLEPHYFDVILDDPDEPGVLDLTYDPDYHTLNIEVINIKELRIESESIYKDEAEIIVGKPYSDDSDYYKQWFIDKNKFTIHIDSDTLLTDLVLENVPLPVSVLVNDEEWWKTNTNWESIGEDDIQVTNVPQGSTTVIIYFQESAMPKRPDAEFDVNKFVAVVDDEVMFDGTKSEDEDGTIEHYIWDFGDDSEPGSGIVVKHIYTDTGTYTVSLTVIDNDNLDNSKSKDIYIVNKNQDDDNDGVPNELDPHPFNDHDTDGDGLSDDFENFHDGDASSSAPWPDGRDLDRLKRDTDGDGFEDGEEIDQGTDPIDPNDYPGKDGDDAVDDEGILGGAMLTNIVLIIVVIIIILVIFMILRKKRKGEEAPKMETGTYLDRSTSVGSGFARPGKREMDLGPSLGAPAGPARLKRRPEPRAPPRKESPMRPGPLTTKKPVERMAKPPLKRLPSKRPVRQSVMLDTLEVDSLKKFLPPQKTPAKVSQFEPDRRKPSKDIRPPPKLPLETKIMSKASPTKPTLDFIQKPAPSKPPLSPLPEAVPPKTPEEKSPIDNRAETIAKFAQALGIGRAKATALYNGGYTTIAQLEKASREELMEIKGIGPKMADRVIKNMEFLMAKRM
jgi:PKD repeat protein